MGLLFIHFLKLCNPEAKWLACLNIKGLFGWEEAQSNQFTIWKCQIQQGKTEGSEKELETPSSYSFQVAQPEPLNEWKEEQLAWDL